jgi:hypothetical protein
MLKQKIFWSCDTKLSGKYDLAHGQLFLISALSSCSASGCPHAGKKQSRGLDSTGLLSRGLDSAALRNMSAPAIAICNKGSGTINFLPFVNFLEKFYVCGIPQDAAQHFNEIFDLFFS